MQDVNSATDNAHKPLVLITGASGLIGSRLAEALAPKHRVVGLDVKPPPQAEYPFDWIEADLTDDRAVADVLRTVRQGYGDEIASVFHLAAYYDFSGEPSPLYQELNVEGTRRLLAGLLDFKVEQFVFSSSLLVMQPAELGEWINEDSPTEAGWDYPISKLETERVIRETHDGIPVVVLRIAGVYDEECHSIPIAQQIARIYEKQLESYFFPGNKQHGQPFVHLDDLVDCFLTALERRHSLDAEELFLIAEGEVLSYAELQERIGELIHGEAWPTIRIPKPVAKAGAWVKDKLSSEDAFIKPWMIDLSDAHYPVDVSRARYRLGWEPRHDLRSTLSEMIARLKQDPRRWYETNKLPVPETANSE